MDIKYSFIGKERFSALFKALAATVFESDFDFRVNHLLSDEEKVKVKNNQLPFQEIETYYLIAEIDDQVVGWSVGHQLSKVNFFMGNSAVLPAHRNQGIYTTMLDKVVDRLIQNGYQKITSKHKMANNAILIPKLKYGFVITGFEVNDEFGCLVELCYFTNPARKELYEIRVGARKMDANHLDLIR